MNPDPSVRSLLIGFDSGISDALLESTYAVFCAVTASSPAPVAFKIVFQQIRAIYVEFFKNIERECAQLQVKVETLTEQLEQLRDHYERTEREISANALVQFEQQRNHYERNEREIKADALVQFEQQRVQYEARLAESRADRAEAIAHDNQNTQVMHNHLLQIPRFAAPVIKGSTSRAESWRLAKREHTFLQRKLPTKPAIVQAMRTLAQSKIDRLLATRYGHETMMYTDFLDVLRHSLHNLASFHDTSNNPFLAGQKPDLTLATEGAVKPEPDLVCIVIEVKKVDAKNLENDKDLGQLLDYLVAMFVAQPGRRIFAGVLSCVSFNIVVTLEVCNTGWTIVQHNNSDIYETFAYLSETALVEQSHLPPSTGFIYPYTNMRRRLGNPRHSMVAEFPVHNSPGLVMAIKRYANPASEIFYLDGFSKMLDRPSSIPLLVYTAPDVSEFGITPVGAPLVPSALANHNQAQQILKDVFEALVWLHKLGIVHRDVRAENVVTMSGRGILIDFDGACDYRRGSARPWRGGYICCPPSHVRHVIANNSSWSTTLYSPGPSDDWCGWVLLANSMMFPNAFAGFRSHLVGTLSVESTRLLVLWDALEKSKVWGRFVDAANHSEVEVLCQLPEMFVWL